ncbi:MAG: galactose-1-phosphate uridylyltransferase, partial [Candidatus Eisenbacteria sp.]|nr:galactose-1-phosphate uridylyltransferase [Candidatus Eisenbacteria bacterium]
GRWVIISTERGKRPSDFSEPVPKKRSGFCPFCPGNEEKTPPEVYAIRENGSRPNGPGWKVRVVSNKFPALQIEGDLDRRAEGMYDKMNGVGAHEVIIESPDHMRELSDNSIEQLNMILCAYRARMVDLARDKRFRYIQVFKNHGEAAGASLEHSHTQLVATPIVPRRILEELNGCSQHFGMKERCIFCDIIDQELTLGKRVVIENADYISIAPFAPRFPFETWILPKSHHPHFEQSFQGNFYSLARILKENLMRMNLALNNPPYNFVLHTAPCNDWRGPKHHHWHIEIMPKLTRVAGFEWGTGFYINPTAPEDAASYLRDVQIPEEEFTLPTAAPQT